MVKKVGDDPEWWQLKFQFSLKGTEVALWTYCIYHISSEDADEMLSDKFGRILFSKSSEELELLLAEADDRFRRLPPPRKVVNLVYDIPRIAQALLIGSNADGDLESLVICMMDYTDSCSVYRFDPEDRQMLGRFYSHLIESGGDVQSFFAGESECTSAALVAFCCQVLGVLCSNSRIVNRDDSTKVAGVQ